MLEYILALGNHLNKGTARGQATGFKLDGLLKFTETKGVDQSTTLLHYLCSTVSTKSPDLLTFPEENKTRVPAGTFLGLFRPREPNHTVPFSQDLNQVKQAAKMTFSIITANLQELQAGVTKLEAEAQHAEPDTGMAEFAIEARANVVELQAPMPDT